MLNGKTVKLYTGLGRRYYDLCRYSKTQCLDQNLVASGFTITCNIDDIMSLFHDLADDDGNVVPAKNNYATRAGLTTKSITTNQVVSEQVLHALLQNFEH